MTTAHVTPDPRLESRTRRRFSAAEKIALIDQFDALPHGDKGGWLRQNGLYAAQLSVWRKERREHGAAALEPKPPGQKPKDPREVRIEQLTRELAKLRKRAELAEALVELQRRVLSLDASDPNDAVGILHGDSFTVRSRTHLMQLVQFDSGRSSQSLE